MPVPAAAIGITSSECSAVYHDVAFPHTRANLHRDDDAARVDAVPAITARALETPLHRKRQRRTQLVAQQRLYPAREESRNGHVTVR